MRHMYDSLFIKMSLVLRVSSTHISLKYTCILLSLTILTQCTLIYKGKFKIKLHCYQYFKQLTVQNYNPEKYLIVIKQ